MILFSFVLFALLVVSWVAAPTGAKQTPVPAPAPALKLSETPA